MHLPHPPSRLQLSISCRRPPHRPPSIQPDAHQNLIKNQDFEGATRISKSINILDSNLLIQQAKNWINNSDFQKFNKFFSCENESDIISEFFFLISNFYASNDNFEACFHPLTITLLSLISSET